MDICRNRDAFRDTVLVVPTESGEEMHYLFITAILRPFMLVLLPLELLDIQMPPPAQTRSDIDKSSSIDPTHIW
eukprot:4601141-Amphidinium_carterae.1